MEPRVRIELTHSRVAICRLPTWQTRLMVRGAGIEPTSQPYQSHSINQMRHPRMVDDEGIEPSLTPYKSVVLTNTLIVNMVDRRGIEPLISVCKTDVFPLAPTAHMVEPLGIEPSFPVLHTGAITRLAQVPYGMSPRIRTLTNCFGDSCATITLATYVFA